MEDPGRISSNELMEKISRAKKVMDKVETKTFQTGQINADVLRSDPSDLMSEGFEMPKKEPRQFTNEEIQQRSGVLDINRIEKTKLPENIKRAMIEHPISQIALNDGIDMSVLKGAKGAKRLIEQENRSLKTTDKNEKTTNTSQRQNIGEMADLNSLQIMVENTIRKVLDEKLNQILMAQESTSINENLVIRVGDSIFKGKLTKVDKVKK